MRKKSPYEKSALAKILRAEKRKNGISLLRAYADLGMGQVAFLKRIQIKGKALRDSTESKKIASFFKIPEESVHLSFCDEKNLSLLFYENPSIIFFLKDLYEKSKNYKVEDFIGNLLPTLNSHIENADPLSKMDLIKKLYLSGEELANISKITGLSYQTVLLRVRIIKDLIEN
jgi:hypothetical protein